MHDEKNYIHNLRSHARKIYAIRQVDDLIMWISYSKTEPETKKWADKEKERIIRGGLYKGGLVLEEQKEVVQEVKKKGNSVVPGLHGMKKV